MATQEEKQKALDAALGQIEKQFGKGAIMKLGDSQKLDIEAISTGSFGLDLALGIGGLPMGRIVEIFGPESSGKTTLTLSVIAEAQKAGKTCAFIDAEHALDPIYASKLGVDVKELLVSQPDNGEQALEICDALVRSGAVDVIIVDSVAALTPKAEIEERVHAALKTCGLYEFRSWPISALSFGQKKRVTIASILVLNPEIILLDEPTAGQDQRHYTEMMDFLDELNQQGHTIIMITHDMQLMLDYSDRSVVVVDGQILADKAPAQVLTDQELISAAHLKETSIFALAEKIGADPLALTEFYMREKEDKHA